MKLLSTLKRINPFRSITMVEDATQRIAIAKDIIKQSNATIARAEYIRHMAVKESEAATYWLAEQKGTKNDHPR